MNRIHNPSQMILAPTMRYEKFVQVDGLSMLLSFQSCNLSTIDKPLSVFLHDC